MQKRVLILEDDFSLAYNWAGAFTERGYIADVAQKRDEAEGMAEGQPYDVVVVDLFIEGMDGRPSGDGGIMLISHLRRPVRSGFEWAERAVIVAVTGAEPSPLLDHLEFATSFGADMSIRKPVQIDQLIDEVEECLRQKGPDN